MSAINSRARIAKDRDLGLDFVKGFLVVVMALYHGMNYFSSVPAGYYGYLRFVNGSFVFISGYVVAAFYADQASNDRYAAFRRLAYRGIKLLCIFTVLNLAISALGVTNYRAVTFGLPDYLASAADIYGSGQAHQIAFRILVPISYVLMVSGLYLVSQRSQAVLVALTIVAALLWNFFTPLVANVFFVLTGLVGLSFGLLLKQQDPLQHRARSWPLIVLGFVALASVMNWLSGNVLAYGVGVGLLLKLAYDGSALLAKEGRAYRWLVLLGKYSLVSYIVQIAFLFALHRALRGIQIAPVVELALAFFATCAFLLAACLAIEHLRHRFRLVERTYRLVFA
jgi:peptidoglycan/LPS O-acetylase OafA/YrhL